MQLGVCWVLGAVSLQPWCLRLFFVDLEPRKIGADVLYQIELVFDLLFRGGLKSALLQLQNVDERVRAIRYTH